ncbi:MAG TPA: FprA family A-type flavoprotein, partial [Bacteroidales bacterium]|nr:FprA family A-type flavoprotein [Bacteroidales bacterium]
HTEPDHSGCVASLLEIAPHATVVSSGNGIRYLKDLVGRDFPQLVVKDGQVLDLGNKKLRFISAPNLHWPDSMFTYLEEEKILFTCDGFGEHYCNEAMFDDVTGDFSDSFRYYFDVIMKPFSRFVLNAIEKIGPLDISMIAPGHGTILRSDWRKWVQLTEQYAREAIAAQKSGRVFVAYVSAYQNTKLIAEKIAEGLRQAGEIEVDLCDIEKMPLGEIEEKLIASSAIILGSPTFNQNILLPVYRVLALINPIRDRGKLAAAFGSYGWSGEGAKIISSGMANLKLDLFDEGLMIKFTPHKETTEKCIAYGKAFGKRLLGQHPN